MTRRFLLASALLLASLPLTAQIPPLHHVLFVDGVNGNDTNNCKTRKTACKTISHAISLASPDDAILVAPATYYENLTISFNLRIIGSGAKTTIIDGEQENTVVTITNNNALVVLADLTIRDGATQDGSGGGVANSGGTVTIYNSIITQNFAVNGDVEGSAGGGIFNSGTLTLDRSTVSQNQATGNYYCYGGGIYNTGMLTIANSTISENSFSCADVYGAAIYDAGTIFMSNSTIAGNSTEGGYYGGAGLYEVGSGTATISSSTIVDNISTGSQGGGIEGPVTMQNSIIADNQDGNCLGTVRSYGYNLSSDNTCDLTGLGDLNNTEPKLGPLQNNGGPTQTVGELEGSPTIDAGNPKGCTARPRGPLLTTDQRGAPRPGKNKHDKRCDMGAFERQTD
jgi:hypothetical protein